ncbi:thiamine phosphate synthase [Cysteiniphilum sp. 6C5]|uniref:thiamine phosphate synthase n=1 Tax=unclassified Cysteiniphilum TaxID=2610889 RepID=UPI003F83FE7A
MMKNNNASLLVIGGIDPTAHAGVLQDIKVANYFKVDCAAVISANTVQNDSDFMMLNAVDDAIFYEQFTAVVNTHKPQVIKSGVLASIAQIEMLSKFLQDNRQVKYICDPVLMTSSGGNVMSTEVVNVLKQQLLPLCYLLTPNLPEAAILLNDGNIHQKSPVEVTNTLKSSYGIKHVLLKGGHALSEDQKGCDYLTLASQEGVHYQSKALYVGDIRGTGCALASSIAALVAQGENITEAICIAKYHLSQQMDSAVNDLSQLDVKHLSYYAQGVMDDVCYLPKVWHHTFEKVNFPQMPHAIGFYPVVDHVDWLEKLAILGVRAIQLRLKDLSPDELETQIKKANGVAKAYDLSLFINDHWQLAIKYGCFGVHLGQEDLDTANLHEIAKAGLHLGISTHNYIELARALTLKPSYIALGPIYSTTTKEMKFNEQGLDKLRLWRKLCQETPLVAIGGIFEPQMLDVWQCGVDGVAVVSYITKAQDVQKAVATAQDFEQIALGNRIECSI